MEDVFENTVGKDSEISQEPADETERHPVHREPEEYSDVIRNEPIAKSKLSAFVVKPKEIKFETQDSEEKILLLLRKHVMTNLGWIVFIVVMSVLPVGLTYIPIISDLPGRYQVLILMMWYLVLFGYGLEKFLSWYFNVYIITDERIIDYDFYSLMYKRVSEAKIDRVEDVTFSMGGAVMNMFNYGDVYIQTAGEQRELEFEAVPRPEIVVKLLNELAIEEEREKLEGRVR